MRRKKAPKRRLNTYRPRTNSGVSKRASTKLAASHKMWGYGIGSSGAVSSNLRKDKARKRRKRRAN